MEDLGPLDSSYFSEKFCVASLSKLSVTHDYPSLYLFSSAIKRVSQWRCPQLVLISLLCYPLGTAEWGLRRHCIFNEMSWFIKMVYRLQIVFWTGWQWGPLGCWVEPMAQSKISHFPHQPLNPNVSIVVTCHRQILVVLSVFKPNVSCYISMLWDKTCPGVVTQTPKLCLPSILNLRVDPLYCSPLPIYPRRPFYKIMDNTEQPDLQSYAWLVNGQVNWLSE